MSSKPLPRVIIPNVAGLASRQSEVKSVPLPSSDAKKPVVLEIGRKFIRYGIAGEIYPRKIVPSYVKSPISNQEVYLFDKDLPAEEKKAALLILFKKLISQDLLTFAKDRGVILVEDLFFPKEDKKIIAEILFDHHNFLVPFIAFLPAMIGTLIPFGISTALVIDFGYSATTICPVFCGIVMVNELEEEEGISRLHKTLREYLISKECLIDHDGTVRRMNEEDLATFNRRKFEENLFYRFCMATRHERGHVLQHGEGSEELKSIKLAPDVDVPFGTRKIRLPGYIREALMEFFFEGPRSIANLVVDVVSRCPIDVRRSLYSSIILTGGGAGVKGLAGRLKWEICNRLEVAENGAFASCKEVVRFLRIPDTPHVNCYNAWVGGSLFGDLEDISHRVYSEEQYRAKKPLPDWSDHAVDHPIASVPDAVVTEHVIEHVAAVLQRV